MEKHRRQAGVVALMALITGLSFRLSTADAGGTPEGTTKETSSAAGTMTVNVDASRIYVFVGKTGLGHEHGIEGRLKSGTVRLGATEDAGELVFDMASFDADTPAARKHVGLSGATDSSTRLQVNQNMKAEPILDVRRHPTASFEITSCREVQAKNAKGQTTYELNGKLTLRGRAHALKFRAVAEEKDGVTKLRGDFTMLQTNFGITPFRKALGAVGITNELKVYGDLVLKSER
jgi:polyisoprenoid-binding protein YceI